MDELNLSEGLYIRVASLEIQARKSMRLGAQAITRDFEHLFVSSEPDFSYL